MDIILKYYNIELLCFAIAKFLKNKCRLLMEPIFMLRNFLYCYIIYLMNSIDIDI